MSQAVQGHSDRSQRGSLPRTNARADDDSWLNYTDSETDSNSIEYADDADSLTSEMADNEATGFDKVEAQFQDEIASFVWTFAHIWHMEISELTSLFNQLTPALKQSIETHHTTSQGQLDSNASSIENSPNIISSPNLVPTSSKAADAQGSPQYQTLSEAELTEFQFKFFSFIRSQYVLIQSHIIYDFTERKTDCMIEFMARFQMGTLGPPPFTTQKLLAKGRPSVKSFSMPGSHFFLHTLLLLLRRRMLALKDCAGPASKNVGARPRRIDLVKDAIELYIVAVRYANEEISYPIQFFPYCTIIHKGGPPLYFFPSLMRGMESQYAALRYHVAYQPQEMCDFVDLLRNMYRQKLSPKEQRYRRQVSLTMLNGFARQFLPGPLGVPKMNKITLVASRIRNLKKLILSSNATLTQLEFSKNAWISKRRAPPPRLLERIQLHEDILSHAHSQGHEYVSEMQKWLNNVPFVPPSDMEWLKRYQWFDEGMYRLQFRDSAHRRMELPLEQIMTRSVSSSSVVALLNVQGLTSFEGTSTEPMKKILAASAISSDSSPSASRPDRGISSSSVSPTAPLAPSKSAVWRAFLSNRNK